MSHLRRFGRMLDEDDRQALALVLLRSTAAGIAVLLGAATAGLAVRTFTTLAGWP